ncbi:unnamed protein product, partial [Amaranthus hypochondriacus]
MGKQSRQKVITEELDSLPWNSSLPNEDPFAILSGSDNLQGGFLSLEEIDESEYDLTIPGSEKDNLKEKSGTPQKTKKRKRVNSVDVEEDDDEIEASNEMEESNVEHKNKNKKKKKKKVVKTVKT